MEQSGPGRDSPGEATPQIPPGGARGGRLLALSREAAAREPAAASPGQGKQQGMVMVWPQLVSIELVSILVFTAMLLVLGTLVNAPLDLLANPDRTPNPSKAPWYFLNLQELLLHMHPTLAGVLVPGGALVLLAAIPYIDNTPQGTGRWFTTPDGKAIAIFSIWYATILNLALILFNQYVGIRRVLDPIGTPKFIIEIVIPIAVMYGLSHLLAVIVQRRWGADRRHILIALFSGFFATFLVLTIIGTAFRGPGMNLYWPWEVAALRTH